MSQDNSNQRGTNRDVRPQKGQQSNENWDENSQEKTSGTNSGNGGDARRIDEQTNTSGAGSSQRNKADNVGPLQSDLEQLPSEKRRDRGSNSTGSGLG